MVGQNIGKYRVLDRIGRGGMGTVYRALDETLHREVAIKVLNAELNDPEVARRFRAEAVTVARLNHPGIATIFELFQNDGQWLMVMEYVRGETLERMVERLGPQSPQRAADLLMQALTALSHAHSMGVVHRDLKPANLMSTEAGAVKIMDFGIARVSGSEHLTNAGFMMGTPAYMAPEQVMGQEIDARTDLYALGVVFYYLVSGKLPFKGETPIAMAQSRINDNPTPLSVVREGLPPWLEPVLERALSKQPEGRFQTADQFREALRRGLAGLPMDAAGTSTIPPELVATTPPNAMPISRPTAAVPPPAPAGSDGATMPLGSTAPTILRPSPAAPSAPVESAKATPPSAAPAPNVVSVPPPGSASVPGADLKGGPGADAKAAPAAAPVAAPAAGKDAPASAKSAAAPAGKSPAAPAAAKVPEKSPAAQAATKPAKDNAANAGNAGSAGKKTSAIPMIAAAAVVLIAIAAGILWMRHRSATEAAASADQSAAAPVTSAPAPDAGTPASTPAASATSAAATTPSTSTATPPAGAPASGATPSTSGANGSAAPALGTPASATPGGVPGASTSTSTSAAANGAGARGAATPPNARGAAPTTPPTAVVGDDAVAFSDAKVLLISGRRADDEDVVVKLGGGQIEVTPKKGGAPIATEAYSKIVRVTFTHARDPRWESALPHPADSPLDLPGVFHPARNWLVLQSRADFVILRLDDANVKQVLDAIQGRAGMTVTRLGAGGD